MLNASKALQVTYAVQDYVKKYDKDAYLDKESRFVVNKLNNRQKESLQYKLIKNELETEPEKTAIYLSKALDCDFVKKGSTQYKDDCFCMMKLKDYLIELNKNRFLVFNDEKTNFPTSEKIGIHKDHFYNKYDYISDAIEKSDERTSKNLESFNSYVDKFGIEKLLNTKNKNKIAWLSNVTPIVEKQKLENTSAKIRNNIEKCYGVYDRFKKKIIYEKDTKVKPKQYEYDLMNGFVNFGVDEMFYKCRSNYELYIDNPKNFLIPFNQYLDEIKNTSEIDEYGVINIDSKNEEIER